MAKLNSLIRIDQYTRLEECPENGFYLFIIDPAEKPPHIALLFKGLLYNATINRVYNGVSAKSLFEVLRKKEVPALLLKLQEIGKDIDQTLSRHFGNTEEITFPQSCLMPVTSSLNSIFKLTIPGDSMLPELLATMTFHNLAGKYYAFDPLNKLPSAFVIGGYSRKDIENNIIKLKKQYAERKNNTPAGSRA